MLQHGFEPALPFADFREQVQANAALPRDTYSPTPVPDEVLNVVVRAAKRIRHRCAASLWAVPLPRAL